MLAFFCCCFIALLIRAAVLYSKYIIPYLFFQFCLFFSRDFWCECVCVFFSVVDFVMSAVIYFIRLRSNVR